MSIHQQSPRWTGAGGLGHGLRSLLALALALAGSGQVLARDTGPAGGISPQGTIVHGACKDAYETDDFLQDAKLLAPGVAQAHNFDGNFNATVGIPDKDWAKFQVVPGGVYTITTTGLSVAVDTTLLLTDASGKAVSDGTLTIQEDFASDFGDRIIWQTESAGGTYYVLVEYRPRVAEAYEDCVSVQARYTLTLTMWEPFKLYMPMVLRAP